MSERLTLRQVAQAASERHGGKRGRALGREAERRGLTLSYTTVDKILAGTYTSRPGPRTLEALATLAGLPVEVVYQAAGIPLPLAPMRESLPPDADLLTPDQRRVVLDVVRAFASANKQLHDARVHDERTGPVSSGGGTGAGVAPQKGRGGDDAAPMKPSTSPPVGHGAPPGTATRPARDHGPTPGGGRR